jgi:hypothetical protein
VLVRPVRRGGISLQLTADATSIGDAEYMRPKPDAILIPNRPSARSRAFHAYLRSLGSSRRIFVERADGLRIGSALHAPVTRRRARLHLIAGRDFLPEEYVDGDDA